MQDQSCLFCKIIKKELPAEVVKENDLVIVIKDIAPKAPTHFLIIPKVHVETMDKFAESTVESESTVKSGSIEKSESTMEYAAAMIKIISELCADLGPSPAYNIISNNGAAAGQSVDHVHWHFLAGKNIYDGGLKL
jgi:histidine triad (HIT) family protein